MKTTQALVTVGGKGSRLKKDGIDFSFSKAFLKLNRKAIFYWCLHGLYAAGITKLVITGDMEEKLKKAEEIIGKFPYKFNDVVFFQDKGFGAYGLPLHTNNLLDEQFFFECGHSMCEPEHYKKMDALKKPGIIVFSAFDKDLTKTHFKTIVNGELVALSWPNLLDKEYISQLESFNFEENKIIPYYLKYNKLEIVKSNIPPELDTKEDYNNVIPVYKKLILKNKWFL